MKTWLAAVEDFVPPEDGSRGISGLPAIPSIPAIFAGAGAIVATGGAALPAIATMMVTQVIMNQAGSQLESIRSNFDPNSPINVFKKAFLKDGKSILSEAWLQDGGDPSILKERLTALIDELIKTTAAVVNLEQPLKDVALVDITAAVGDDLKARFKGKALEF